MPYSDIKSSGIYNLRFYYDLKGLNPNGGFIFWNSGTTRWEQASTLGGSPIIAYLEGQKGDYPISIKGVFDWKILNNTLFEIVNTFEGLCPTVPTPTPQSTPGPTPTPTLVPKCEECNLGFKDFSNNLLGQISVGELTGTCANITDYRILWYGPNSDTEVRFITAKSGSTLGSYGAAHPLTNDSALLTEAGVYRPVIDKIKIGSTVYSQSDGSGLVKVNLDCLPPITVKPIECSGGNNTLTTWPESGYSFRYKYLNISQGQDPLSLSSSIKIPKNIKFFAIRFKADNVTDILRITFNGKKYNTPIVLENVEVGGEVPFTASTLNPTASLKKVTTGSYYVKVLTLTNLDRDDDDILTIKITPSTTNNLTTWDLFFECLTDFNDSICWENDTTKIVASSVSGQTRVCGQYGVIFKLATDCLKSNILNSDIGKYLLSPSNFLTYYPSTSPYELTLENLSNPPGTVVCGNPARGLYPLICISPASGQKIVFKKYISTTTGYGEIEIEFNRLQDLIDFYQNYQDAKAGFPPDGPVTPNDPTNIQGYYRSINLNIPNPPSPDQNCGDTIPLVSYTIHPSSQVTTAQTSNSTYNLTFTMPTITNQFTDISCSNCFLRIQQQVNFINDSSTATTNNRTIINNIGARYLKPFGGYSFVSINAGQFSPFRSLEQEVGIAEGSVKTYPMTGSPLTFVPSLSGQCFSGQKWASFRFTPGSLGDQFLRSYYRSITPFYYRVTNSNPNPTSYQIEKRQLNNNGIPLNPYEVIGVWSANTLTIINPNYFV